MRRAVLWVLLVVPVLLWGCGGGKLPEAKEEEAKVALPEGHPPVGGAPPMASSEAGETDGHALPLKLAGVNSAQELEKGLRATQNVEAREAFESGFRKTFTSDASKRDYQGAIPDLERAIALDAAFPHAYRALGYAKFNIGFNTEAAFENYKKAVDLDPSYGEAHYALAFLYVTQDLETGAAHFKKAMELGVPDERNLGERFYAK